MGDRNGKVRARQALYLPEEILLHHIFLKLPIEDVAPCKYVCNTWNRIIQDPDFATLHLNKNRQQQSKKLLIKDNQNKFYSADYDQSIASQNSVSAVPNPNSWATKATQYSVLNAPKLNSWPSKAGYPEGPRLIGSQNGLVLVQICTRLVLWNPITGESKLIPDPDSPIQQWHLLGFAYDSNANDYKIMLFIYSYGTVEVDVYSLRNDSWNYVNKPWDLSKDYQVLDDINPSPVEVNGYMYWMTSCTGHLRESDIIGFNLTEDKFVRVNMPVGWPQFPEDEESNVCWGLADLGNSALTAYMYWKKVGLFLVCSIKEPHKNKPEPEWEEVFSLNVSKHRLDRLLITCVKPLLITDEGKLMVLITYGTSTDQRNDLNHKFGLYDRQQNHLQHIQINGIPGCDSFIDITYLQTLVSPHLFGCPTQYVRVGPKWIEFEEEILKP